MDAENIYINNVITKKIIINGVLDEEYHLNVQVSMKGKEKHALMMEHKVI